MQDGGRIRFRPIMMTTGAMVLGAVIPALLAGMLPAEPAARAAAAMRSKARATSGRIGFPWR